MGFIDVPPASSPGGPAGGPPGGSVPVAPIPGGPLPGQGGAVADPNLLPDRGPRVVPGAVPGRGLGPGQHGG